MQNEPSVLSQDPTIPRPANDLSRLYYESHITIVPLTEAQKIGVDALCAAHDFRRSTFEMHKDKVPNAFISARDVSYSSMVQRVRDMAVKLQEAGLEVIRWKIEDTCLDSNRGDVLPGLAPLAKAAQSA